MSEAFPAQSEKPSRSAIITRTLLIVVTLFKLHQCHTARSRGVFNLDNLVMNHKYFTSKEIAGNLNSVDRHLAISSLDILSKRDSDLGTAAAQSWLSTEEEWLHGATYLGERGDPVAIPYLIRGLDHPYASGLYDGIARILENLTDQKFGKDKQKWVEWWQTTNPAAPFDFSNKNAKPTPRYRERSSR